MVSRPKSGKRKSSKGPEEILAPLSALAEKYGYNPKVDRDIGIVTLQDSHALSPVTFRFDALPDEEAVSVVLVVRTSSWDFAGERTDLHDVLSMLAASGIRVLANISSSLWHDPGFVNDDEIYLRVIALDQPDNSWIRLNQHGLEQISKVLWTIAYLGHRLLPHAIERTRGTNFETPTVWDDPRVNEWASNVADVLGEDPDDAIFQERLTPNWRYYRSFRRRLSILRAPGIAKILEAAATSNVGWTLHRGINGHLYLSGAVNNFVSFRTQSRLRRLIRRLNEPEGASASDVGFIPLENYLVAAGGHYAVFLNEDCSRGRFLLERDRIARRHQEEIVTLFPPRTLEWSDVIDDDHFELLIRDLLQREPGVKWVRRVSPSKERDGGRDLICEWHTPPTAKQALGEMSSTTRRVVVQCKAFQKTVGKSAVTDISDTMAFHSATGYFLAVSSQLSTTLTDHLDRLRSSSNYFVDWWTRAELEDRLNRHPDLVSKYPAILRPVQ